VFHQRRFGLTGIDRLIPQALLGIVTVTFKKQQSYGLPLAAAAALKPQISMTADDPGGPLTGIFAGFSVNGPPGTLTGGVRDTAVTVLIQPGPVTVNL
jgi:hypothetical protein